MVAELMGEWVLVVGCGWRIVPAPVPEEGPQQQQQYPVNLSAMRMPQVLPGVVGKRGSAAWTSFFIWKIVVCINTRQNRSSIKKVIGKTLNRR
jgi:hypothetical protein